MDDRPPLNGWMITTSLDEANHPLNPNLNPLKTAKTSGRSSLLKSRNLLKPVKNPWMILVFFKNRRKPLEIPQNH